MIYERTVDDMLILEHESASSVKALLADNFISINQRADSNIKLQRINQHLYLNAGVNLTNQIRTYAINHALVFTQAAHPKVTVLQASNNLILWHSAERQYPIVSPSVLVFSQLVTVDKCIPIVNTLVLIQAVGLNKISAIAVENVLTLVQSVAKLNSGCNPLGTIIIRADNVTFTLGSYTFDFRNPLLGDVKSIEYTRIARETTGGDKIVFRSNEWAIVTKIILNFDVCDPQPLKDFIGLSLGRFFTYKDHEDITWTALIVNPETAIVQTGRYTYNINLEMEI